MKIVLKKRKIQTAEFTIQNLQAKQKTQLTDYCRAARFNHFGKANFKPFPAYCFGRERDVFLSDKNSRAYGEVTPRGAA